MTNVIRWWSAGVCAALCLGCSSSEAPPPGAGHGTIIGGSAGGGTAPVASAGRSASGGGGNGGGVASAGTGGSAGSSNGGSASGGAASGGAPSSADSMNALEQLRAWIALDEKARPELAQQGFAKVPLDKASAAIAKQLLVDDYTARLKATRAAEMGASASQAKTISAGGSSMKYYRTELGKKPASGWNLFISMHGGGNTDSATNDSQWDNQLALATGYDPKDAIWIAPRAPSDEWNMWFTDDIAPLFEHLIANFIAFEGVDPNHVYLNGYSAGGDGAYQMGPRMADAWAGVGMSAGHPNDSSPLSLRNTAFAIHVGGDDTSYDRNKKAAEWGMKLDELAMADSGGYIHQWQVHAGLPHWMEMEDAVSIPFMQQHARDPIAKKVVWRQSKPLRSRFYWLAVATTDVMAGSELTASYAGQSISIDSATSVKRLTVRVSDAMLDQDLPISIKSASKELFSGTVSRTIGVLYATLEDRGDPGLMFAGEVQVALD